MVSARGRSGLVQLYTKALKIEQGVKIPILKRPLLAHRNFGVNERHPVRLPGAPQKSNIETLLCETGFLSRFLAHPFVFLDASPISGGFMYSNYNFRDGCWMLMAAPPKKTPPGNPRSATDR